MAEKPSAATEALSKVEDQLTCLVCLDPYTKPKLLQCFHVYCENCLQEIAAHDRQRQHSVTCPKCRRPTPLPPTGVSGLQSAFHVHHLFDIQETLKKIKEPQKLACEKCVKTTRQATSFCRQCSKFICDFCSNMHSEWEEFETHEVVGIDKVEGDLVHLVSPKKELLRCPKHDKKLKLFCDTCGELICHHCTVQIHKEHNFCVIADTFESHKKDILASVEPVKKQLEVIDQVVTNFEASRKEISELREIIKADIHQSFQQLHKALEDREAELAANTDQLVEQKLQNLQAQKAEVEIMQAQRESCLHFITESVRTGSQSEVMKSKKQLIEQVKDLTENFKPDTLKVREQVNVSFLPSPQLIEHCQKVGTFCMVSPDHCHVDGKGNTIAEVGDRATAIVHVCDDKNQPNNLPLSQLECKLVSTLTNKTTKCTVTEQKRGQYEIAYQPTTPGLHNLLIKINGKSIRGSPFAVRVKRSIDKLGAPFKTIEGLNRPWGVVVNKKGEVIVAEAGGKCVSIFSPPGKQIRTIYGTESSQGRLGTLRGLALDNKGNILVLDSENCQLRKFSPNGQSLKSVGGKGDGSVNFTFPIGVGINNANRRVYIVDFLAHCVHVLSPDLSFVSKFCSYGEENGQLNYPYDVAFHSTGNVYVADSDNNRIQVFTPDGQFLRLFEKKAIGNLEDRVSICIDSEDLVYVSERVADCISVFTCEGKFLKSFGSEGSGLGQFDRPIGITVDQCGVLYVGDYGNNRVQLF